MTGEDIHTLVGAYALDAVDDIERARFDRHLASCPSCAQEVAELRAAAGRLADLTDAAPPARLKEAVLAGISRTPQVRRTRAVARPGEARWRRWTAAAVAAGIIALGAAAATFAVEEQRVRDTRAQAAQAEQVAAILGAPDAVVRTTDAAGGRVTVVVSDSLDKGVAVLHGLTDPGAAHAYQLWLIRGGHPDSAGVLAAGTGDGTEVFAGVRGADTFGVTREPAGGSASPTPPMVGAVKL
jgi:anti-sigma factor RsiW